MRKLESEEEKVENLFQKLGRLCLRRALPTSSWSAAQMESRLSNPRPRPCFLAASGLMSGLVRMIGFALPCWMAHILMVCPGRKL